MSKEVLALDPVWRATPSVLVVVEVVDSDVGLLGSSVNRWVFVDMHCFPCLLASPYHLLMEGTSDGEQWWLVAKHTLERGETSK